MGAPRLTRQRACLAVAFVAVVAALLVVSPAGLLMLSPALALLSVIALGLFPSDELIRRIARRLRRPRRAPDLPAAAPADPRLRRTLAVLPFALAVRPPPRVAARITA